MLSSYPYFVWEGQPEAFTLGPLIIRWYGLLFAFSFLCGYQIMTWVYRTEKKPEIDLDRLFLHMFLGIVIGARLGHCLFYDPGYFLSHPLEILKIWRGGLASHGALIGVFLSLYLYSRSHKDQPYLWLLSRMTLVTSLGGGLIRLGNFFNSEIIGQASEVPWAIVFARIDQVPRHPSQIYESLSYILLFAALAIVYRRYKAQTDPRLLLGLYLAGTFTARFLIEFTKEVQSDFEHSLYLHLGQWLSLPLILLGFALLYQAISHKQQSAA